MEPLTAYEVAREPLTPLPPEARVPVPTEIREELRCMICREVLKEAKAVAECLHRFCKDCAELAVRKFSAVENDTRAQPASRRKQAGGAECPLCRTNIASRRDLYDDPHFQSLVNVIFPHMAADEAAEQCAVEESTKQHQRALLLGRQRAARTDSSPRPPSASPPPPTLGGLEKKEEDGMEEAYAAAEAEAAAAVDPEIAALRICFAFRPLSAALAVAAAAAAGAEGGGAGGGGGGGGERWVLPSVGDRKLFRTTAGATVAALKRLLARRLALARPSHLELCLVLPAPVPAPTTTVVVLDDALTLAEAVTEVWTVGGDVGEELVLHYCLRGPERRGVGLDCEG